MAARQFLPHRRADPHREAASAQGLQPRAAAPRERPVGGAATGLRHRARDHRARRRPRGPGKPHPLRGCLSGRHAAQARRAVGDSDHAAACADRESAPRRHRRRRGPRRSRSRRQLGRSDEGDRGDRPQEPRARDRGHGALEPADDHGVRVGALPAPSRPRSCAGAAAHLDRAAAFRIESHDRAAGPVRHAAAGRQSGVDQQQHRQSPLPRRDGLAAIRRVDERRRAEAARRPGRMLRRNGFCHPRPIPPRGRAAGEVEPAAGSRGGALRGPACARGCRAHGRGPRCGPTYRARRFLPDRRRAAAARPRGRPATERHGRAAAAGGALSGDRVSRGDHGGDRHPRRRHDCTGARLPVWASCC